MAENAKCKICRAVGEKLFLKGDRCFTPKCAVIRKPYPPGVHGQKRRRGPSEYGQQLKEKQKVRALYGVGERQFRRYFEEVSHEAGLVGENLMAKLETRLDNVIFRAGFALSRSIARQLVSHGHFLVNTRRVDIPSYAVRPGEIISIRAASRSKGPFNDLVSRLKKHEPPAWLRSESDKLEIHIIAQPLARDIGAVANVPLVVEYYSR